MLTTKTTFLKNLNVREADYRLPDNEENKEDDNTVINNEKETPQAEDVTQDQEDVRSNCSSPCVSYTSSKTTKLKGKSYQA